MKFTLFCVVLVIGISSANIIAAEQNLLIRYTEMCEKSGTKIPAPEGETDLKDSPNLKKYCLCFAEKFAARAMLPPAEVDGKVIMPSLETSLNEELAMRNSCRKKYDLPQVTIK